MYRLSAVLGLTFAAFPDQQYFHYKPERKAEEQANNCRYILTTFVVALLWHVENVLRGQQDNRDPYCVKSAAKYCKQWHVVTGNMPSHTSDHQGWHRANDFVVRQCTLLVLHLQNNTCFWLVPCATSTCTIRSTGIDDIHQDAWNHASNSYRYVQPSIRYAELP